MSPKKKKPLKQRTRKPTVSPTEQRKLFRSVAAQLRRGESLSEDQTRYLAEAFDRIGRGESADKALQLKRGRGQRLYAEQRRRTMSLVFAQVAHYMAPTDGWPPGEGLNLQAAMEKVVPLARGLFATSDDPDTYSVEYLLKCWHDPSYAHMRTTLRSPFDPDSPLELKQ